MIDLPVQARFGLGEAGNDLLLDGFDAPEDGFVWSVGAQSRILVPRVPLSGPVYIELSLSAFVHPPGLVSQRVEIAANGVTLAQRRVGCATVLRLDIPQAARRGALLTLTLRCPDAVSPQACGVSDDTRALGMRLTALTLLHMAPRTALPPPAGPSRVTDFRFGADGDTGGMLGGGWGAPETDFVWAVGRHSELRVPGGVGERRIILHLNPFLGPPDMLCQRVAVGADGHLLGFVALRRRSCVAFVLPAGETATVTMTFDNLDAAAPRDTGLYADGRPFAFMLCGMWLIDGPVPAAAVSAMRPPIAGSLDDGSLQAAVRGVAGREPADIAAGFESLGFACELGLLQRRLGREPNGLMRFSGMSTPCLIEGILNGFWGLGRPDTMTLHRRDDPDCGYWVEEAAYELGFQTPLSSLAVDEPQVKRQLARALPFLARKFFEDVAEAAKIFVFQRRDPATREEAEAVLAALSVRGDATVLWVVQDVAQAGSACRLSSRLFLGFVDDAAYQGSGSDESWLSMLANLCALRAEISLPAPA